jgi:hypothetical protein
MATLDALRQRSIGRWQTGFARAGSELERTLRTTSPVDTGEMQSQTRVLPAGPYRLNVAIETPYASYVRDGTAPHEIVARNASALRFEVSGSVLFRKRVQHPGTRPDPWYKDAIEGFPQTVSDEIGKLPS